MDLQTPARILTVSEDETAYGGRVKSFVVAGTVWGDFRPSAPVMNTAGDDAYVVQGAEFIVRTAIGIAVGGRLRLKGLDWTVISIDEATDGDVRVRIERVHP